MHSSTPAEFFITFLTTSKKYELCLQDNLGHGFSICWITLHLLKFESAAIGKKKLLMYLSTPAEFFITFLTTSKKYEICLQDNLGHGFFLFVGLHCIC